MARIILKCPYLQPGEKDHLQNMVRYIATRDGVEKLDDSWKDRPATLRQKLLIQSILRDFPGAEESYEYQDYLHDQTKGNASDFISRALEDNYDRIGTRDNYVRYIACRPGAERFGTHGLFTDAGVPVDLEQVAEEVSTHDGPVWTNIISLRREDAAKLGYDCGAAWRDLLRSQASTIAKCMKIPPEDLRWYAAFHNESHHPHVHLIAYSAGKTPYLSKQGIRDMKSSLAREIFKQDLLQVYQAQTRYRDALSQESRDRVRQIVEELGRGDYRSEEVETMMRLLSQQLRKAKGKKVYGYLPQTARDLVNSIIDELGKDERIAELYTLWYQQRDEVVRTYQDSAEERLPLSQNKTFQPLRNIVVSEVLKLSEAEPVPVSGTASEEHTQAGEPAPPTPEEPSTPDTLPALPAPADSEPLDEMPPMQEAPEVNAPPPGRTPDAARDPDEGCVPGDKKESWWSKEYKQARRCLYGTKDTPPDLPQAYDQMLALAEDGNGLAMHDLGKMLLTGLGCEENEVQAQDWFAKAHSAFLGMVQSAKKPYYWQYRIGKLYAYGYGVEQDDVHSAEWFEKAVEGGNPFAAYALGGQYDRGKGVEQDHEKAFQLYTIAATDEKSPNAYAQYQLGRMCRDGIGTEPDAEASAEWYRQAYQGFLAMEQTMADDKLHYRLGSMDLTGTGTDIDLDKARAHFEQAAELHNLDAHYGLGKLYLRKDYAGYDPQKATWHLTQAAEEDHVHAQYLLGKLLLRGEAVPQDIPGGIRWLERAVAQSDAHAQYLLGKTLLTGELVPAEPDRGAKLLEQAVAQGNIYAAYTLGKAYLQGEALPQDTTRAIELLTTAAEGGMTTAQYALAKLYLAGELVPQDMDEAVRLLRQAAEAKDQYAQYLLGKLLLYGQGIPADVEAGKELLRASAAQGNVYAQRLLDNYGTIPIRNASVRLLSALARMLQEDIDQAQTQKARLQVDRKLLRQLAEKKQAQGIRLG